MTIRWTHWRTEYVQPSDGVILERSWFPTLANITTQLYGLVGILDLGTARCKHDACAAAGPLLRFAVAPLCCGVPGRARIRAGTNGQGRREWMRRRRPTWKTANRSRRELFTCPRYVASVRRTSPAPLPEKASGAVSSPTVAESPIVYWERNQRSESDSVFMRS